MRKKQITALALSLVLALGTAGCAGNSGSGDGSQDGNGEAIQETKGGESTESSDEAVPDEPVRIATKPMTEQFILGEMLKKLIEEKTGYEVELTKGIG